RAVQRETQRTASLSQLDNAPLGIVLASPPPFHPRRRPEAPVIEASSATQGQSSGSGSVCQDRSQPPTSLQPKVEPDPEDVFGQGGVGHPRPWRNRKRMRNYSRAVRAEPIRCKTRTMGSRGIKRRKPKYPSRRESAIPTTGTGPPMPRESASPAVMWPENGFEA